MRDGLLRAVASASHPIELGAMLAMLVPISLALAFTGGRRWWITTGLLVVGLMASVSRTPVLVTITAGLILLWLRPRDMRRLIPLLIPLVIVVKIALPGSIATVKNAFFPEGGIVAEALPCTRGRPAARGRPRKAVRPDAPRGRRQAGVRAGLRDPSDRVLQPPTERADPRQPVARPRPRARLVGVFGWIVLLVGGARRLAHRAREEIGPDGWLAAAFAASIVAFGVGMFTFDSLAFTQVTFVFWIIVSLSASLLLAPREQP